MTWSSRVMMWSSHFESLVYKLDSVSSQMNFNIFSMFFSYKLYRMSDKVVPNVVLVLWLRGSLDLSISCKQFFSFHFTALLHSQSITRV